MLKKSYYFQYYSVTQAKFTFPSTWITGGAIFFGVDCNDQSSRVVSFENDTGHSTVTRVTRPGRQKKRKKMRAYRYLFDVSMYPFVT